MATMIRGLGVVPCPEDPTQPHCKPRADTVQGCGVKPSPPPIELRKDPVRLAAAMSRYETALASWNACQNSGSSMATKGLMAYAGVVGAGLLIAGGVMYYQKRKKG